MSLNTKYILSAVDKTGPAFKSVIGNAGAATKKVAGLATAALSLAGVGGFGALVTSGLESADSLAKVSDKIGATTEGLSKLQYAVSQTSDVSENQFNMAMQRLARRTAEAANGVGEAKDVIKELGLDAQALNEMGPDKAFLKISDAIKDVDSRGEQLRMSFKLFDSEGAALINTLDKGSKTLNAYGLEAEKAGLVISRIDAAKAEAANDAFDKGTKLVKGLANTVAIQVAPVIADLSNKFFNAATEAGGMGEVVNKALRAGLSAVGVFANGVRGISVMWGLVKAAWLTYAETFLSGLSYVDDKLTAFLNKIPGVTATASQGLKSAVDYMKAQSGQAVEELHKELMKPLPSTQIEEYYNNVQRKSQETAEIVAANSPGAGSSDADKKQAEIDGLTSHINKLMELKKLGAANDAEFEELTYLQSLERQTEARNRGLITEERYREKVAELADNHGKKLTGIEKKWADLRAKFDKANAAGKVKIVAQEFQSLMAIGSAQSKKMFRINQVAAISEAVISTYQGAAAALKWGWPMGPVFAAAITTDGLARVKAIKSQKYGGGGGGSVGNGATAVGGSQITTAPSNINLDQRAANENNNEQTAAQAVTVILNGFVDDEVVFESFKQKIRDQDYVLIEEGSRQHQELLAS